MSWRDASPPSDPDRAMRIILGLAEEILRMAVDMDVYMAAEKELPEGREILLFPMARTLADIRELPETRTRRTRR